MYWVIRKLKTNSHITRRAHAVALPYRAAKDLEYVFPIWFTQCGRVWLTLAMPCSCRAHAVPRPCLSESDFSRPRHSTAWALHGMCELTSTCPLSGSSGYHAEFHEGCYKKHTNLRCRWPVWSQTTSVMYEEKPIIFVQERTNSQGSHGGFPSHFHKFRKTCQQTIITQCTLDQNKQLCLLLIRLLNTLLISVWRILHFNWKKWTSNE